MRSFDILLIGGNDGDGTAVTIKGDIVASAISLFWQGGGSVLFLHDSIYGASSEMGSFQVHCASLEWGTTAQIVGDSTLNRCPFSLPASIDVAQTHSNQKIATTDRLVRMPGEDAFYFGCNGRVGLCQAGHAPLIQQDEKKLLANIIVHLVAQSS
jgi:hypothetical protein